LAVVSRWLAYDIDHASSLSVTD